MAMLSEPGASQNAATENDGGRYSDLLARGLETRTFASKGDRTRYRLKIAAAKALEEIGYQNLRVSDVCTYADVALGTFYVYYRDKNEIATEVVLDFVDHLYDRARQVGRGTGEYEAIYNTNRFFISAYQANAGLMQCHVQLQTQLPAFRAVWRPRHLKWIEVLARSIARRGDYRDDMPGTALKVARVLEGMVFHYLYSEVVAKDSITGGDGLDPDELANMLSILWYRAVYCRDPPHLT